LASLLLACVVVLSHRAVLAQPVGKDALCPDAALTLTLHWDESGRDWELHLIRPGGRINDNASDCTWTSCIGQSPDWGRIGDDSDDPHKDRDETGPLGPEQICLGELEQGTYSVLVEHWSSGGSPAADGYVVIELGETTYVSEIADLPPHHVWTAATIDWPSGDVQLSTESVDCSAQWSGGCQMALP